EIGYLSIALLSQSVGQSQMGSNRPWHSMKLYHVHRAAQPYYLIGSHSCKPNNLVGRNIATIYNRGRRFTINQGAAPGYPCYRASSQNHETSINPAPRQGATH